MSAHHWEAIMIDYKYEFERLLDMAEQAIGGVDFKNRSTLFAPLRALKNAVDYYRSEDWTYNKSINLEKIND